MPAAAITPAWRIPPPTTLRARRASAMNARSPHTTEPTGAASPLLRQNVTESASATSAFTSTPSATAALKMPRAVQVDAQAVLARQLAQRAHVLDRSAARRRSGCACSRR